MKTYRDYRAQQVADALKNCGVHNLKIDYALQEYRYVFDLGNEELSVCVPFCEFDVCGNKEIEDGVSYTIYNLILSKVFEKYLIRKD